MCDEGKFYNLEAYLFDTVSQRFRQNGGLNAFDFFCIVIWKANRAKSKVASRLFARDILQRKDLDAITSTLTKSLFSAEDDKERMRILTNQWGFRLPLASAILTVLYPENFTVYDVRVCDMLQDYHNLRNLTKFDEIWKGYCHFMHKVKQVSPSIASLRDKDRYLWGKSFKGSLESDIKNHFGKKI